MGYVYWEPRREGWYCAFRNAEGMWRRRATGVTSKTLARKILQKYEHEEAERRYVGAKTYPEATFRQFAAKYLRHSRATNSRATAFRDRVVIDNVLPHMGGKRLLDIRRRDIQDYLDRRASTVYERLDGTKKRIAPATVDRERVALMALFTFAVDGEFIPADQHPVKRVKAPKAESTRQRELTPEEEVRLLAVLRDPAHPRLAYLEDVVLTGLNTGMREGELLSLKWGNVDLTERTLTDGSRSYGRITVESTNDNPTKDRTTREVPINKALRPILETLHKEALHEAEATPAAIRERFVFTNPRTGKRYVDTKIGWYAALRDAGITGFRFHDLRHTFATRARRAGMPLEILQRILGHSDISTTMRYAHVGRGEADRAINLMCATGTVQRQDTDKREVAEG